LKLTEAIVAFPAIFVAFTFHYNFFPILESLKNPTNKRIYSAGNYGILLPMIVYLSISTMGYMIYGDNIDPNYLKSVKDTEIGLPLYMIL